MKKPLLCLACLLLALGGNAKASSCGDVRQQLDMAQRFYRDRVAYLKEGESDLADASRKNLLHELDLVSDEVGGCSDASAVLDYYRLKTLYDADSATYSEAVFASLQNKDAFPEAWFKNLEADFNHAVRLGLQKKFPSDYASLAATIASYSPATQARRAAGDTPELKADTAQARADLKAAAEQFPLAAHVLSVKVSDNPYHFTYTIEGSYWSSSAAEGQDAMLTSLARLARLSYKKGHNDRSPEMVIVVDVQDENGAKLATMLGDERMFTP